MKRWFVIFKSHADGLADLHFVDVVASSPPAAVKTALRESPPFGAWVLAIAEPWPVGCDDVDAAVDAFTATG